MYLCDFCVNVAPEWHKLLFKNDLETSATWQRLLTTDQQRVTRRGKDTVSDTQHFWRYLLRTKRTVSTSDCILTHVLNVASFVH